MSTTSCIFGSCCRLAVKQRRDLHIILFSVVASVMIYGMLLASGSYNLIFLSCLLKTLFVLKIWHNIAVRESRKKGSTDAKNEHF